ncbi:hypothetical protein ACHQM5_007604 [Ranunculus cassubicifolius]
MKMEKMKEWMVKVQDEVLDAGKEDPRRMVHCLKVGLTLTLASLLYLLDPLFHGIGTNSIYAVLTVTYVLDFTAGATLYKGANRGIGTLSAVFFSFLVELVARHSGKLGSALCIAISVFIIGAITTYVRFISSLKNYDQAVTVFLITFNMLLASGYHDQTVWQMMFQRIYTIAIGFAICFIVSVFIFPYWSGEDLQNSIVKKFEVLAELVQAHVEEYFHENNCKGTKSLDESDQESKYREILEDTAYDESLANCASWEPRHSRYLYPWKQYMHLETVLHHFGHNVFALHGCLESQIQAPQSVRALFREPCKHVADEVVKVLGELADAIKNHHHCSPHISDQLHEALEELNSSIKFQPRLFLAATPVTDTEFYKPIDSPGLESKRQVVEQSKDAKVKRMKSKTVITCLEFSEALPFAAFTSLLVETAARLDLLIEEVEELGRVAHYQECHEDTDIAIAVISESGDSSDIQKNISDGVQKVQSTMPEVNV